jgi:mono/diheme cytochrome c family protein
MRIPRIIAGGAALIFLAPASASAQEPAKFFEENCAVCHAIGGSPGAAPDLKDITKRRSHGWLIAFITNPDEAAKTDPEAAAIVKGFDGAMPATEGATPEVVDALLRYIDASSGNAAAPPFAPAARTASAADLAAGRDFYQGHRALAGRAPACISCHHTGSIGGPGGGRLGPDLTYASQRLGGARGLTNWLNNPPTKVMRAIYRPRPLADDERFALAAMLAGEASRAASTPFPRRTFMILGLVIALAALAAMALVWSRRMTAVRRPLVDAARARLGDDR